MDVLWVRPSEKTPHPHSTFFWPWLGWAGLVEVSRIANFKLADDGCALGGDAFCIVGGRGDGSVGGGVILCSMTPPSDCEMNLDVSSGMPLSEW